MLARAFLPSGNLATLDEGYKGVAPGFDVLRLALAVLIFYAHCSALLPLTADSVPLHRQPDGIAGHPAGAAGLWHYLLGIKSNIYRAYVPMFFALSGYLVCSSAIRINDPLQFFAFRAMRIFPALSVEVLLSAVLLGAAFTTLPLRDYFADDRFWRYLANIVGVVSFELPGVFQSNPLPAIVNANLWTLPAEFYCYFILIFATLWIDIRARRQVLLYVYALVVCVSLVAPNIFPASAFGSVFSTASVTFHFFTGALFYLYRDRIRLSLPLLLASVAFIAYAIGIRSLEFAIAPAITYVTIYIGYVAMLRSDFIRNNDYSYGIYLYGFPIQQSVVALVPGIGRLGLFALGLSLTIMFAAASWLLIERRFLALKALVRNRSRERRSALA